MKKATKKKPGKPSIEPLPTMAWLKGRFDKLERDHKLILDKLGGGFISSELSEQIRLAVGSGKTIDRKVPDLK